MAKLSKGTLSRLDKEIRKGSGRGGPARIGTRLNVIALIAVLMFSAMFVRLWYLQVLNEPSYQKAAVVNEVRNVEIPPPRGMILDRSGKVLVGNQTTEEVTLSRTAATQHPEVVARLAAILSLTPDQVIQLVNNVQFSPLAPVPIKSNVDPATIVYLEEHASQFPGVQTQEVAQRVYPGGTLAAQVLGYTGQVSSQELKSLKGQGYQPGDQIGKSGIENAYEPQLRGTPGTRVVAVDRLGNVVGKVKTIPPVPGQNVQLSLDSGLESVAEQALASEILARRQHFDPQYQRYDPAVGGSVVVEDPRTGAILAMASYPTYDPSIWVGGISSAHLAQISPPNNPDANAQLNRAIQGLYVPGSTFKLITATAALQDGLLGSSELVDDPTGFFTVPNCTGGTCTFHDDDSTAAGEIDITKAITISDDVFFYKMGYDFWIQRGKYGETPIQDMAAQYGLGEPTGIDLLGDAAGRVDSPQERIKLHTENAKAYPNDTWYPGDNIEMAFGQGGTTITLMQLVNAYATFANDGTRYVPHLLADTTNYSGTQVTPYQPKVAAHITYSQANYQAMLAGFEGVVANPSGTAYYDFTGFPLNQLQVAGKTGTASQNGKIPTSVFVSFAPATNAQYVVGVVIDQAGYGADAAAPVARQIYNYLLANPITPVATPAQGSTPGPVSTTTTTSSTTTTTAAG